MQEGIIKTENLSKSIHGSDILKNVNLSIDEGEIFGLIGPDQAGKTTLILTLNGFYRPTTGRIFVNGSDLTEKKTALKRNLGYLPQRAGFYELMTAAENLAFFAGLYGFSRGEVNHIVSDLLQYVSLKEYSDTQVKTFSPAMLRRLGLAKALVHQPKILLLDEPYSGLDAENIDLLSRLLKKLAKESRTILLSATSYAAVASLCTYIGVLLNGELVWQGRSEEFRGFLEGKYHKFELRIESAGLAEFTEFNEFTGSAEFAGSPLENTLIKRLNALETSDISIIDYEPGLVTIRSLKGEEEIFSLLNAQGIRVLELISLPQNDEELYLHFCHCQKQSANEGGASDDEKCTAPIRE